MLTKDCIKISEEDVAEIGDVVHIEIDAPYSDEVLLTKGKLCHICYAAENLPFVEIDVNGVIVPKNPTLVFKTRRKLIEHHIESLQKDVEYDQSDIDNLHRQIHDKENHMGQSLIKIHALKKELYEL